MKQKKALSVVVVTSLLLLVAFISIFYFGNFYESFISKIQGDVDERSKEENLEIRRLSYGQIYLYNPKQNNISIVEIGVGDDICEINKNISFGVSKIDVLGCSIRKSGKTNIFITTENELFESSLFVKNIAINVTDINLTIERKGKPATIIITFDGLYFPNNRKTKSSQVDGNVIDITSSGNYFLRRVSGNATRFLTGTKIYTLSTKWGAYSTAESNNELAILENTTVQNSVSRGSSFKDKWNAVSRTDAQSTVLRESSTVETTFVRTSKAYFSDPSVTIVADKVGGGKPNFDYTSGGFPLPKTTAGNDLDLEVNSSSTGLQVGDGISNDITGMSMFLIKNISILQGKTYLTLDNSNTFSKGDKIYKVQ